MSKTIINPQHPYKVDKVFLEFMNNIKNQSIETTVATMVGYYHNLSMVNRAILENYFDKYSFWGSLHDNTKDYTIMVNRAKSMHDHYDDFIWLFNKLEDNRSKLLLYGIVCNWYYFQGMEPMREAAFSQYFDLDIMKCDENEVFVDVGAYKGETTLAFCSNYTVDNYKKIFCYEITPSAFRELKNALSDYQNVHCKMLGLSDVQETMFISENTDETANSLLDIQPDNSTPVITTTLDKDIEEPVTFIKMDIEGFEERALKGASNHIKNDKPKLAIAVYHSNEDIWKLPRLIDSYNPDYKFHLRYHGGNLSPTEITLLAV